MFARIKRIGFKVALPLIYIATLIIARWISDYTHIQIYDGSMFGPSSLIESVFAITSLPGIIASIIFGVYKFDDLNLFLASTIGITFICYSLLGFFIDMLIDEHSKKKAGR